MSGTRGQKIAAFYGLILGQIHRPKVEHYLDDEHLPCRIVTGCHWLRKWAGHPSRYTVMLPRIEE